MTEARRLPVPSATKMTPDPRQGQRQRQIPPDPSPAGGYKATGVEYVQNGVLKRVYLKTSIITMESAPFSRVGVRSVILSAGAIMTPALLMNSGVGPRETLEGAGIKVLMAAEAVGRNLQNQPAVGVTVTLKEAAVAGVDCIEITTSYSNSTTTPHPQLECFHLLCSYRHSSFLFFAHNSCPCSALNMN